MDTPEDAEERVDAVATPATVEARAMIGSSVRVSIRSYYSSRLLWTAQHHAELAGEIERELAGKTPFSSEHVGYVLSSIITSVAFLEAMINELFQDAADGHAPPGGFITPLTEECRRTMAEVWAITRGGRVRALEKFDSLLRSAGAPLLDRKSDTFKNAEATTDLRNRLIHFRPEDRSAEDEAHAMEKRIRGKFSDNALMTGSGNAWWPDHALGYGAAVWAHRSVKGLADHVSDAVGIEPNYRKVEASGWFGQMPGEREAGGFVTDTVLFEIAVYRTSLETWRKEVNDYIDKNGAPWVIERFLGSLRARDVSSGHGGLRTPDSRLGSDPR